MMIPCIQNPVYEEFYDLVNTLLEKGIVGSFSSESMHEYIPDEETFDLNNQEFLRNLNHQIRNSMNAIMGFAQVLRNEGISKEDRELFSGIVCHETEHLLETFNQIILNLRSRIK
jgi:signal transduction histidine kinase